MRSVRYSGWILIPLLLIMSNISLAVEAPTPADLDRYVAHAVQFAMGEGLSHGERWPEVAQSRDEIWSPNAPLPANVTVQGVVAGEEPTGEKYTSFSDRAAHSLGLDFLIRRDYGPPPESEYPKLSIHGEVRTRTFVVRNGMDLGFNAQPRLVFQPDGQRLTEDPPPNIQKISDEYEMVEERITLPVTLKWNPDIEFTESTRITNRNVGHLKYPDEQQFHSLQIDHRDVSIVELYVRWTSFFMEELTARVGRFFLEKEFKIFGADPEQVQPTDGAQLIYTSNPWQALLEVTKQLADQLKGQPITGMDAIVLYKTDWLRAAGAFVTEIQRGRFSTSDVAGDIVLNIVDNLDLLTTADYKFGTIRSDNTGYRDGPDKSAFGIQSGARYHFNDLPLKPSLFGMFYYFSGGSAVKDFEVADGGSLYYGYLADIRPVNTRMVQGEITFDTSKFTKVILDYWAYEQVRSDSRGVTRSLDNGGIQVPTNGIAKGLGQELDVIFQYRLLDNLTTQVYGAWFFPGRAFGNDPLGRPFEGAAWQVNPFEFRWQLLYTF